MYKSLVIPITNPNPFYSQSRDNKITYKTRSGVQSSAVAVQVSHFQKLEVKSSVTLS
jgi:hypothetical protein